MHKPPGGEGTGVESERKGRNQNLHAKKLFVRKHLDRHAYQVMSNRLVTKGFKFVVEILSGEVRPPHYIS